MTTQLEVVSRPDQQPLTARDALTALAEQWLAAKAGRSGSVKTARAYRDALRAFRAELWAHGLDLDGEARLIALLAQDWAARPGTGAHQGRAVTPATYNQRLAILSSFYSYAIRQGFTERNPISRVERRPVQDYARAVALDAATVRQRLKMIDRATLAGRRDYALLAVALQTGRRVSELAALRWGDLTLSRERIGLTWQRAKGGKVLRDNLPAEVSQVLLAYLHTLYGPALDGLPADAPVWVSLSPRNRGQAMTIQTVADICLKRLGTSKVHTLRHTFAHTMEQAGARVSDIQARLGHESLHTTGRYLAALSSADNAQAERLAELFGIGL
jgi:integrase